MSRTRPFSIFLLKQGYDATNSLRPDHALEEILDARQIPARSRLFVMDTMPLEPWWRGYFGIPKSLSHAIKGALLFITLEQRCFVLSFGHVFHNLNDSSYEYDFGLKVTLNSLDPLKLKSADIIDPGSARRRRTQVPSAADLTFLDFDSNAEIVRSLTGKVKDEFSGLFKSATGSASLKIGLSIPYDRLEQICETLLALYARDDYMESFPNIGKLAPEKDPEVVSNLDDQLLQSFREKSEGLSLAIPDLVDYRDNVCCTFKGRGGVSEIYTDVSLDALYDYLGDDYDFDSLTVEKLKKFGIALCDPDGRVSKVYSVYNSLLLDITDRQQVYHICEGGWYRAEVSYVQALSAYIDSKCEPSSLIDYNHDGEENGKRYYSEENYNSAIPVSSPEFICLDQTDIAPDGNTQIEPCDLYAISPADDLGVLYHLKISTRSSQLSHLFNQGVNSAELLILEQQCRDKFKGLIRERLGNNDFDLYQSKIDEISFKVVFGVITKKQAANLSGNLPLFSKISLMRAFKSLELMQIPAALIYINDASPAKEKYSAYEQVIVQVMAGANGVNEVRVIDQQCLPEGTKIKGCCSAIRESPVGSSFRVYFNLDKNGSPYSNHSWEYELI